MCPPTALKTWCEKANIQNGAVFRGIKKGTVLSEAISINYFSKIIKNVARSCNLATPEKYSGHSLRRGFATTASQQGITLSSIMQHGRWKHSDTALGYMEEAKRFESNVAGILLKNRAKTKKITTRKI